MDVFVHRAKAAQRDLIDACGGIERVAAKCGYSKSEVGRWRAPGSPDLMSIDAVVLLERDCGRDFVTASMANANGRRLTDPDEERRADVNVLSAHAAKLRSSAEVANAMATAIEDGHLSPAEAAVIDRAAAAEELALSELRAALAVVKARGGVASMLSVVGGSL